MPKTTTFPIKMPHFKLCEPINHLLLNMSMWVLHCGGKGKITRKDISFVLVVGIKLFFFCENGLKAFIPTKIHYWSSDDF